MALWTGLGQAATLAQLVGADVGSLISMIVQAAMTAHQNRSECKQLASRVLMIAQLMPHVQEPEAAQPLAGLGDTLRDAHQLVVSCQGRSTAYQFFMASRTAEKFREVKNKIDSYLILFPVISHVSITRRLERIYNVLVQDGFTRDEPSHPLPQSTHHLTAETLHPSRLGGLAPLQAIQGLIADLSSAPRGSREEVTEVHHHLYGAVFSVVTRLCFGDAVDEAHVRAMRHVIQRFQLAIGLVKPFTAMGSVIQKLVEWRRLRRLFAIEVRLKELFLPPIEARRQGVESPRPHDDDGLRPYADSLVDLRVPDEDGGWRVLRDDEMVQLISEFLGAGTGTVVASLEWALAHLVDKPEVQEKLRGEVDDGAVSRAGAGMPYLHAVVLETLRMHPPLPVIPRHVHADAVGVLVGGMAVPPPAGDFYVNFSAGDIRRDSKKWTDPDEFRPERFLPGGDGEGVGPLPGPKLLRMMSFGARHRFCPGVGMAMVNMKCFLAALVREFEWEPPTGTGAIELTELDSIFKVTRRAKSI